MNKLLVCGFLLAGVMTQPAFAVSPSGVEGNGCAISPAGQTMNITLKGGIKNRNHGAVQAGTLITRTASFEYDVTSLTERCGVRHVQFEVFADRYSTTGPIQYIRSSIQDARSGKGLRNSTVTVADATRRGRITLKSVYRVLDPRRLMAKKFSYDHTFKVRLKALPVR